MVRNDDAFGIKKPSWPRFYLLWTYYIDLALRLEFLFSKEVLKPYLVLRFPVTI